MRIRIAIHIDGADDWTDRESSWGQTTAQAHEITFETAEDVGTLDAISSAFGRLLSALQPPRLYHLLADLIVYHLEDVGQTFPSETALYAAAEQVLTDWQQHDLGHDLKRKDVEIRE
jgi:hypothetical protein